MASADPLVCVHVTVRWWGRGEVEVGEVGERGGRGAGRAVGGILLLVELTALDGAVQFLVLQGGEHAVSEDVAAQTDDEHAPGSVVRSGGTS